MWSSGPASHGQASGNAWRDSVMTRQPALENRITVAWPMPRLAPVSSSVRRGVLAEVGIEILQAFGFTDKAASWSMGGPAPRGEPPCGLANQTAGPAAIRTARAL